MRLVMRHIHRAGRGLIGLASHPQAAPFTLYTLRSVEGGQCFSGAAECPAAAKEGCPALQRGLESFCLWCGDAEYTIILFDSFRTISEEVQVSRDSRCWKLTWYTCCKFH